MTLQQIRYVITVSEAGSLNKAAEILYVAQPSLSASVHDLEKELGFSIFYRSGKGMILTNDGLEFLGYARQLYDQYEVLQEKYFGMAERKKKFGISTQHYSFAVKSFVELVKQYDTQAYEFAIRETKTKEVIEDVRTARSEIGVLYVSNFNRKALTNLLHDADLSFYKLIDCDAYVYVWKGHPLAGEKKINLEMLAPYPCLSFEQGSEGSFYYAEEIYSTAEYPRTIKANDRATMLNLMVGLNGYTLCSGIICEELNGSDFTAVPFEGDGSEGKMEIGYIVKKNMILSEIASRYVEELKRYLANCLTKDV